MHILVMGCNHQTTPIELRERFTFADDRLALARQHLRQMKSILECVIVSTCNRMELYVVCDQLHTGEYYSKTFLEEWFRIPREDFQEYLYCKQDQGAVNHMLRVVAGLDSLVIGETQILGQIKRFFLDAQEQGTTGTLFNTLFRQAIQFGKRVHTETSIGKNPVSVSYAAVELAKKIFTSLANKKILLLGAGKMSELTAKHFADAEASQIFVINRTFERAKKMAGIFQGEARAWADLATTLREVDIVVSSTGASELVVTKEEFAPILAKRRESLFLIDIAVPRDIDPKLHQLDNVFLYNIDDLQEIVAKNLKLRQQEASRIEEWITTEVGKYFDWLNTLGVIPLIDSLRQKALGAQEEVMQRIERKLPDLTEQERRIIRKQMKSLINQFLRDPIVRVKELAAQPDREQIFTLFAHLFALEEEGLEGSKEEPAQFAKSRLSSSTSI
ncbi:glutamyl-tRNA reductase [Seinonella peptonophila]|uniref:Glutamyl-tRNA reductase n=1 Tax=Seinonella peptonophila TaxID=112248 RepID=A0A1M4TUV9_9BACL|nr:glutamyl-tRNA reductase [Seinonella peptonophila]SHE48206.1 glutamyl-tRNA reductase [Seinonella peptonophila]